MKRFTLLAISIILLASCSTSGQMSFTETRMLYGDQTVDIRYPVVVDSKHKSVTEAMNHTIMSCFLNDETPSFESIIDEARTYENESIGYNNTSVWHGCESDDLLSIYIEHYMFTGGAHGGIEIHTLIFDKKTGARIDLLDQITDTAQFRKLMIEEYVFQNELDINTSAGDIGYFTELRDLPLTPTMELTDKGLKVYYGQYQVACYAVGITTAIISYDKIQSLLPLDSYDFTPIVITNPE